MDDPKVASDCVRMSWHWVRKRQRYYPFGVDLADVVQEVALRVWQKVQRWRPDGGASLSSWMFTAARFESRNVATILAVRSTGFSGYRTRNEAGELGVGVVSGTYDHGAGSIFDGVAGREPDPADAVAEADAADFSHLSPRLRRVARMRFVDDLNFDEIGRELGVSWQRAYQLCERAKASTKSHLQKQAA